MSVSYFVRYDIAARDLGAFLEYYRTRHVAVLAGWPGLQRVTLHTPVEWRDPSPVSRGKAVLLAQLEFDSVAALDHALASPERAAARRDFERFPPFEGSVTHQAMQTTEAWRRPS
ncbi:MAG TPA: EthD family reductase [Burkholderiales bacterium]|nr:EthD family reductase [Burkholderiales bacterium]